MSEMTTFSWAIAKFRPKQDRAPTPNGTYACGLLHAFVTPLMNLSGRNTWESGPHISGSRWRVGIKLHMHTPLGTSTCPICVLSSASRDTNAAGGNNRIASWITIVTCAFNKVITCTQRMNSGTLLRKTEFTDFNLGSESTSRTPLGQASDISSEMWVCHSRWYILIWA